MRTVLEVDISSEVSAPPGIMEADICIKRHPVFDFRLILVFCTAVRQEPLKQSVSFLRHDFVNRGEANKDYTHLNFKGGKRLAELYYKAILAGVENYKRRMDAEEGDDE